MIAEEFPACRGPVLVNLTKAGGTEMGAGDRCRVCGAGRISLVPGPGELAAALQQLFLHGACIADRHKAQTALKFLYLTMAISYIFFTSSPGLFLKTCILSVTIFLT
jgi:hypothetical protein